MTATWTETAWYALEWIETPTPYQLGGEGTQPGQPVDCSRFVQEVLGWAGIYFTRTTQTQWADTAFPHMPKTATPQPGWVVYFEVDSDGGAPPQHVGICTSATEMIEAPHTGEDVKISTIPNAPGESIYGFIIPPYAPEVIPPLPGIKEETMDMEFGPDGKLYVAASSAGTSSSPEDNLLVFQLSLQTNAAPKIDSVTDVTAGIQNIAGANALYRVQA